MSARTLGSTVLEHMELVITVPSRKTLQLFISGSHYLPIKLSRNLIIGIIHYENVVGCSSDRGDVVAQPVVSPNPVLEHDLYFDEPCYKKTNLILRGHQKD